ncbi:MAG: DUF3500 domain-containing protein [Ignavibacteriota bacterium]
MLESRAFSPPTLTGAQPALYTLDGKTIRPLGQESDQALALVNALDDNQRKQAILNYRVPDLVLGPGQDGKTIQPEGLKAADMDEKQRAMLLGVIAEWAGIVHESAAATRMAELKADINETWFAWSGSTTATPGHNITAYYRIQGPHLVIEYSPQQLGGDPRAPSPHHVSRSDQRLRQKVHVKMNRKAATAAILLLAPALAKAHRLDEYLQAAIISVEKDRLQVQMTLTPGVAVYPVVAAAIDADADGVISQIEQRAYAARVLRDLSLRPERSSSNAPLSPRRSSRRGRI